MMGIPLTPLLLGLAGLIPFLWGMLTVLSPQAAQFGISYFGPRFIGPYVQLFYGTVILSFMSGVLWGFATKATGARAAAGYALSTAPALWAFLMVGDGPVSASLNLVIGFTGILMMDWQFTLWGLTPPWWMRLRLLLTAVVVASLVPVAFG
jgi:hypothetical protein